MLIPKQSPPVIRQTSPQPKAKQTIVTTPDGRRMTLLQAIYQAETMHHDRSRSVR